MSTATVADEIRPLLIGLKEDISSWTLDEGTSRLLNGQVRCIEGMIERGEWDHARGALRSLLAGISSGGPKLWSRGI